MIVVIKKLISGIRKCCVFLFWPRKSNKNRYHTVEVLEQSIIFEAKDGKYVEDGSEAFLITLLICFSFGKSIHFF